MMELSESKKKDIINKLWEKFFQNFVLKNALITLFKNQEDNSSLSEAKQDYGNLQSYFNQLRLPENIVIPERFISQYEKEYNLLLASDLIKSDFTMKNQISLLGNICNAYRIAIEFNANRYSIEDEINRQIATLEDGLSLGSPEYQDGRAFRASIDLYIQTLKEILQMIEDAEKE